MKAKIAIIISICLIILSISIAHAGGPQVQVNDGDDVIQTTDGKLYVGKGIAINGSWITVFNVRFPSAAGAATFPADKVTLVYHKGPIKQQGQ